MDIPTYKHLRLTKTGKIHSVKVMDTRYTFCGKPIPESAEYVPTVASKPADRTAEHYCKGCFNV